jgi:DNA-binding XRE family transcriptional regulator
MPYVAFIGIFSYIYAIYDIHVLKYSFLFGIISDNLGNLDHIRHKVTSLSDLGKESAQARRRKSLTQAELARRAGVGQSTLARFEAGLASEFGLRKLLAVLDVLGYELRFSPRGHRRTLEDVLKERTAENETSSLRRP